MTKALVLSGGGVVGMAWEAGLVAGLVRGGVDGREADLVVGTSAGSAVGAVVALGGDVEGFAEAQRGSPEPGGALLSTGQMAGIMDRVGEILTGEGTDDERRAAVGSLALESPALPEDLFVGLFEFLGGLTVPERFACTAIDAASGAFVVWDAASGAGLDRAVASSCAVPGVFEPVTIEGRRYYDGGFRSATNADLAVGYDRVLIVSLADRLAPAGISERAISPAHLEHEVAALVAAGAEVEVVTADEGGAAAIGTNLMDDSASAAAVGEGVRQGEAVAARLRRFWAS